MFKKIKTKFSQWNDSIQYLLRECSPPGFEIYTEYRNFWIYMFSSVVYSLRFFVRYVDAYDSLYYWKNQGISAVRTLKPDTRMPDFLVILDDALLWFLGGALIILVFGFLRVRYYRRGSMSIYLMKRLGNRQILRRSYYMAPLIYGMLMLGIVLSVMTLYYGFYLIVTPKACLYI